MAEATGRIKWDQTGERWYQTGCDRGVLYKQATGGTYPLGEAWNGLTSVAASPSGAEETAIWADNMKYGSMRSAETFGGTINAYDFPESFHECDGSKEVHPGVYIGQQNRTPFGFTYRTMKNNDTGDTTDDGYILHLVYGATASPSERTYNTINESPEATEMSWEFTTDPVSVEGYKPTSTIEIDSTKVDAGKLKTLEDLLYGTDAGEEGTPQATAAKLPLPEEVFAIFAEE